MIFIYRVEEPAALIPLRLKKLAELRKIIPAPSSDDIKGYDLVKSDLWKMQYGKCCYCENKVPQPYNDVEHYRPKAEANRLPGCALRHGYWWLAYDWSNLLFSCPSCNRSSKNSYFPLENGSISLAAETAPPGYELPLLIDPSVVNGLLHVEFKLLTHKQYPSAAKWWAVPVGGSSYGKITIETVGLNEQDRIEMRELYYKDTLVPILEDFEYAIDSADLKKIAELHEDYGRLLSANRQHSSFAYSVYREKLMPLNLKKLCGKDPFGIEFVGSYLPIGYRQGQPAKESLKRL